MTNAPNATTCVTGSIPTPSLWGAEVLSMDISPTFNHSYDIIQGKYASRPAFNATGLSFCNVSIHYTHPGYDDDINVQVWLPLDDWNGRFQSTGGGGLVVGLTPEGMTGAISEGYAVASTDGGHTTDITEDWLLKSPGNINWPLLNQYGGEAMYGSGVLGKAVTASYYGRDPSYSYFTGCSNGGREGLVVAQRYPELYDGILAGAPATHFDYLLPSLIWGQLNMEWMGQYPQPCEMTALTQAVVASCDALDGVVDGIVTIADECHFDPYTMVNTTIDCTESGKKIRISTAAAQVASKVWSGAHSSSGEKLWFGLGKDTPLSGLANTTCDYQADGSCSGVPYEISKEFIELFINKNPESSYKESTHEEYDIAFHQSLQQYKSVLGSTDPDIRRYMESGGKIMMWHGTADELIPINGTRKYYNLVADLIPNITDFYRYFEAPGVNHCRGGSGAYPVDIFHDLIAWVEEGKAPSSVMARSLPHDDGTVYERNLCMYPQVQRYKGEGDVTKASSFECVDRD